MDLRDLLPEEKPTTDPSAKKALAEVRHRRIT